MRLRLKTKLTLLTALLVLAVMAVVSALYLGTLTQQVIHQTHARALLVAQQVFLAAQHALQDAANEGARPASGSDQDIREYVRKALDENAGLSGAVDAALSYSPDIYEVTIADLHGVALVSSDASLISQRVPRRPDLQSLVESSQLEQLRVLYGPHRVYAVRFPFNLGNRAFGEIRVVLSTTLWRTGVAPALRGAVLLSIGVVLASALFALVFGNIALRPLARISAQLDRISRGEATAETLAMHDEFGQVSTKITRIGEELRGARQIFSNLQENLEQLMSGISDGLLLFAADGRAALASPAVEKFLHLTPAQVLGRRATEIFPPGHPLRKALNFEGENLRSVDSAQVDLDGTAGGPARVAVSVHVVAPSGDGAAAGGALVTLRDIGSLERLGLQIHLSEHLAALGRVTAGVAHEVKNPLNSMRLWLETLKDNLAAPETTPTSGPTEQAVKVLDSEIARLDRVVKTFLDFTRPVELRLQEVQPAALLEDVLAVARPRIERGLIKALMKVAPDLTAIRADPALLKQAILNLVVNACEAMPNGGKLELQLTRDGSWAVLRIQDTGCGIPAEHRSRIFSLFFSTRAGGSGIGLATTYRIVHLHGGSIDFQTEVGRGTTFRIELPLA